MRRALIGAALLLAARPVAASQQCHPLAGGVWRNPGLLAGVRVDAAGYRNQSYEGDFQGVAPTLGFNHPRGGWVECKNVISRNIAGSMVSLTLSRSKKKPTVTEVAMLRRAYDTPCSAEK